MGNVTAPLVVAMTLLIAFTDLPEQLRQVYDDSIASGQQIATAGDMRTIAVMLDIERVRKGRYPSEERFSRWLAETFQDRFLDELGRDHWGHPCRYRTTAGGLAYTLMSTGPDGVADNQDDMVVSGR